MLKRLWPLLPLVLGLLAFARAWDGDFLLMDDDWLVSENAAVLKPSRQDLKDILNPFIPRERFGHEYLPLRDLSYSLDAAISRATGATLNRVCHGTQMLLYGLDCLLAALLLARLTGSIRLALLASCLFALHPVHAEAVCWISSRKDLLALGFALASALAWRAHWKAAGTKQLACFLAAWLAYGAGMLCKSPVTVLPALLLATDLFFPPEGARWRPVQGLRLAPFFTAMIPFQALHVTHAMHGLISTSLPGITWLKTALTMARIGVADLVQLSVPLANRATYRPEWSEGWGPRETLCVLLLMGLSALAARLAWKALGEDALSPRLACLGWGLAWMALAMAPASNLFYRSLVLRADRYLLLPSLGFCLIAALGLEALWHSRRTAILVLGALLLTRDAGASADWQDNRAASRNTLRQDPRHDFPCAVMAKDAARRGDWTSAAGLYGKAAVLVDVLHQNPWAVADASGEWALALGETGRPAEAMDVLDRALLRDPGHPRLLGLRGQARLRKGDLDAAAEDLEAHCRRTPWQEPAWVDLGILRDRQGRLAQAESCLARAVDLDPLDALARAYLGAARFKQGHADAAQGDLEEALRLSRGSFPWARQTLALLHLDRARRWVGARERRHLADQSARDPSREDLRRLVEGLKITSEETLLAGKPPAWARGEALQASALVPRLAEAEYLLGLVSKQEGDLAAAEASLKRAVALQDDRDWRISLAELLRAKGLKALMSKPRDLETARTAWREAQAFYPADLDVSGLKGLLEIAERDLLKQRFEKAASAFSAGNYAQARDGFGKALEIAPDFFEGWLNLGLSCGRMGDWEAAERAYARATGLKPDDAQARDLLVDARGRLKRP